MSKKVNMKEALGVGTDTDVGNVVSRLYNIYLKKIKPIEKMYLFDRFYQPLMTEMDFHCKPMVLLLGQYSVGKTTFISYLLEREFPGARIGPEPTTDRFCAIINGDDEKIIPGNAAAMSADLPFSNLTKFGTGFLNRFEVIQMESPILDRITFIDTPGVLSGAKQKNDRSYDFSEVIRWWADRVDRILLLFDAHKLDISDEFRGVIEALKGNDDKIRIVLNKADAVDQQQLMRIYGALMWSLGRVIRSPESLRVYLGSFWDKPLKYDHFKELFAVEQADLFSDVRGLPKNATVRKINDLVKRVRLAKTHALLLSSLKEQMPAFFGKDKKKQDLIDDMLSTFQKVQREYNIPPSDFPPLEKFKDLCQAHDFSSFPKYDKKMFEDMETVLSMDIPQLMALLPSEKSKDAEVEDGAGPSDPKELNPFDSILDKEQITSWAITPSHKSECDEIFSQLKQINGKVSGAAAKDIMMKSDLPQDDLKKVWKLADYDKDGKLDAGEFAVAMWLINSRIKGEELPDTLPANLIPPSKRKH